MEGYDLYINSQKPTLGLYVMAGAALPDLADSGQMDYAFQELD